MPRVTQQSPHNSPSDVLLRIRPIGFAEDSGIKINIYGRSATGKTTLWSTFPKPILAILCSGGSDPGELRSIDTPANRRTIQQVTLGYSSEIPVVLNHVRENPQLFKTVVLDHVTGFQDLVLRDILGLSELPAQKTFGMASRENWSQCTIQCKEHLRALLSLRCNVVIVAQEREFSGGEEGTDIIDPFVGSSLTPSLAGWLFPACDYIVQTFIKPREKVEITEVTVGDRVERIESRSRVKGQVDYCLRTGPNPRYTTKFRVPNPNLPEYITNPNYDRIMELIKGKVQK